MNASDLMASDHVWACAETADARSVACMMLDYDVGAIPVLDSDGRLEGIVTDRDLCCRVIAEGRSYETPIRDVMSTSVQTVHCDADLHEIESLMREYKIRRLPVVDSDYCLRGFVSFADLARHCHSPVEEHELVGVMESICTP